MVRTTKILTSILIGGLAYSFYRAFTGEGGSGHYDFMDALMYSSVALSAVALIILVINYRDLKNHWPAFIFLLMGLPLTVEAILGLIGDIEYNRTPDLSVKYTLPVTREQYLYDSTHIKLAIDSLISIRNRQYGGRDILDGTIDTIIYSQTGDKVFVSFIEKFEPGGDGHDLHPEFLVASSRDTVFWTLTEVRHNLSGGFSDVQTLKREVRKFYFNQFTLLDKDSAADNYLWRVVM